MTDIPQVREALRVAARTAMAEQPSAEHAEVVAESLTTVVWEELDRMQHAWCGPKGRWGPLPPAALRRIAAKKALEKARKTEPKTPET